MNDDKFIRKQIQKILQEKSKKQDNKGSRRGQLIVRVEDGARAKSSPQELLSNLGVTSAEGDSVEDKVFSVLETAIANINSKDDLKGAFLDPKRSKNNSIVVKSGKAPDEDTVRYVGHILYAAQSSGIISSLDKTVKVVGGDGGAVVQFEDSQ
jgi:hypothetical protein